MLLFGIVCIEILWIYVCVTVWYRVYRDFCGYMFVLLFRIMCIEILWIYVCVTVWYRVYRDFVDICLCYCLVSCV